MDDENQTNEHDKMLCIARKFFKKAMSFRHYINDLNTCLRDSNDKISLPTFAEGGNAGLLSLMDKLYIAWPSEMKFPPELIESMEQGRSGSVSMDQVIEDVIATTLRKSSSPREAQARNVLCNGFSLGSEVGTASVFRNLDIRSPSTQIQTLRTPVWNKLFRLTGHLLFRHLLMNNVLLLYVREDSKSAHHTLASVFLQLCGPLPSFCEQNQTAVLRRSLSNVIMKQDLLYQGPMQVDERKPAQKEMTRTRTSKANREPHNDGLPKSHHLQNLEDDVRSARLLRSAVFQFSSASGPSSTSTQAVHQLRGATGEHCMDIRNNQHRRGREWLRKKRSGFKRLNAVVPVFQKVIKRTHRFSIRRLLGRTCTLPRSFYEMMRGNASMSCEDMIKLNSGSKDVAKFLVLCLRRMIPPALLGSSSNRLVFEKAVHCLLRHRYQWESFDIWRFCSQAGFRITDISWLHLNGNRGRRIANPTDLEFRKARVQELMAWLLRGILLPIMHQNFYVTERDSHRNRPFFFRREVWLKMVDISIDRLIRSEKQLRILSKEKLSECTSRRSKVISSLASHTCCYPVLQYHKLRFVPKKSSLRGIQKPTCRALRGFSKPKSLLQEGCAREISGPKRPLDLGKARATMRKVFRHILKILMMESNAEPRVLGASVFSLNDVYIKVFSLKQRWRQLGCPPLYVAGVDITTSFDTIPLKTLLINVIPTILRKERYACIRYLVSRVSIQTNKLGQRSKIHACTEPGEEASFPRIIRQKLAGESPGSIFTDYVNTTAFTREDILLILEEFLLNNVVAISKRIRRHTDTGFALQSRGLPQGHTLSPLLTSLFYGYFENRELSNFETSVSPPKSSPSLFRKDELGRIVPESCRNNPLSLLMRQVDDTVFITSSKDKANDLMKRMMTGWEALYGFRVNTGKTRSNFKSRFKSKNVKCLPWCGLLINTSSLEVLVDYSRYNSDGNGRLRDSIFIQHDVEAGRAFALRSRTCFKPKLHPLLLDGHINSRFVVAVNVYQAALFACLKLCAYAIVILPADQHLSRVVQSMLSAFTTLVLRSISSRHASRQSCKFPLSKFELRFIVINAFQHAITKRLTNRRRMRARVQRCQQMLEGKRKHIMEGVSQTSIRSFGSVVHRISKNYCKSLWALKL